MVTPFLSCAVTATSPFCLAPFYLAHHHDGHGHPAYDPKTLPAVLLYGSCVGVRFSRQVERRCHEDIASRVLAANQLPDNVTIAPATSRRWPACW